jgi:cysteine protease ATG4
MNRGGDSLVHSSNDGGGGRDPDLDLVQHYCTAYSAAELKTFHCDRVRKLPLSGLDPSMLIGFLCRDEAEWWDFRKRADEVSSTSSAHYSANSNSSIN